MRFIGNKEKLLDYINQVVISTGIKRGTFCDFFSGTTNVGRFLKEKGFKIISSDILYFSYILQKAYIRNNKEPTFQKLLNVITPPQKKSFFVSPLELIRDHLNNLKSVKGFIYRNYTEEGTRKDKYQRKYFTGKNGMKIDAIRTQIERWKRAKSINQNEYFILLASLIESVPFYANISGVYAAFLKHYDPRALKEIKLRSIKIYKSNNKHTVFNKNSMDLIENLNVDILYIDPPYNSRQYGGNYHLLETIARYDNPEIKGKTGMRNYNDQKSEFCNKQSALFTLDKIAKDAKYKYLILSYNSEGIMPEKKITSVLEKYGKVKLMKIDYPRFKSNNNGDSKYKKDITEHLYSLRRK